MKTSLKRFRIFTHWNLHFTQSKAMLMGEEEFACRWLDNALIKSSSETVK